MTVRNISVFGQCQKCKATFTLELAVSGGAILESTRTGVFHSTDTG